MVTSKIWTLLAGTAVFSSRVRLELLSFCALLLATRGLRPRLVIVEDLSHLSVPTWWEQKILPQPKRSRRDVGNRITQLPGRCRAFPGWRTHTPTLIWLRLTPRRIIGRRCGTAAVKTIKVSTHDNSYTSKLIDGFPKECKLFLFPADWHWPVE